QADEDSANQVILNANSLVYQTPQYQITWQDGKLTLTNSQTNSSHNYYPNRIVSYHSTNQQRVETQSDGTTLITDQNGNVTIRDKEGKTWTLPHQVKLEDLETKTEIQEFTGSCPNFAGQLCPYLPTFYTPPPEKVWVQSTFNLSAVYPEEEKMNLVSSSDCTLVNQTIEFKVEDKIQALIISSDNRRIFSKSEEKVLAKGDLKN
ncbi:MAG TPA: hypothetical protein PLQ36_03300, partial [Candidatus Gracilibacteria bacterium]|nr:hypothetical protein [Candidatus Gracilibacteria bacterium]